MPPPMKMNITAPHCPPYWTTENVKVWQGDALAILRKLPSKSVQCVITSPPYFGQKRKYVEPELHHLEIGNETRADCGGWAKWSACHTCYVCMMRHVFKEVRRILKDTGVCWLNLGDKYADNRLLGVPWRVALALQADEWVLRSDLPWVKRNPLPDSIPTRPARSLEYVFMLTKLSAGYYFDMDAIRKPHVRTWGESNGQGAYSGKGGCAQVKHNPQKGLKPHPKGRSIRTSEFWYESVDAPHGVTGLEEEMVGIDLSNKGYPGAHFATFPQKLIEPLIKSSTRTGDIVLDPFLGSGTSAMVCKAMGRICWGIELSPKYIDEHIKVRIAGCTTSSPARS